MKCVLVFLSLVALSYSVPLTFGVGKQVTIDEDGTITILGENGKKIVITKVLGHPGPKDIEITVGGPDGFIKKIHFDDDHSKTVDLIDPANDYYNTFTEEDREKRSSKDTKESSKGNKSKDTKYKSEGDLLSEIFNQYQGVVDAKSYNDLLTKIDSYVKSGELDQGVYEALHFLEEYKFAQKYGYHEVPVERFVNQQYPFNYHPASPNYKQLFAPRFYSPYFGYRYGGAYPTYPTYKGFENVEDLPREREFYPQYVKYGQFGYEQPREFFGQGGEKSYIEPYGQDYKKPSGAYEHKWTFSPKKQYTPYFGQEEYQQPRGILSILSEPRSTFGGKSSQSFEHPSELHKKTYMPYFEQEGSKF